MKKLIIIILLITGCTQVPKDFVIPEGYQLEYSATKDAYTISTQREYGKWYMYDFGSAGILFSYPRFPGIYYSDSNTVKSKLYKYLKEEVNDFKPVIKNQQHEEDSDSVNSDFLHL